MSERDTRECLSMHLPVFTGVDGAQRRPDAVVRIKNSLVLCRGQFCYLNDAIVLFRGDQVVHVSSCQCKRAVQRVNQICAGGVVVEGDLELAASVHVVALCVICSNTDDGVLCKELRGQTCVGGSNEGLAPDKRKFHFAAASRQAQMRMEMAPLGDEWLRRLCPFLSSETDVYHYAVDNVASGRRRNVVHSWIRSNDLNNKSGIN